MKLLLDQNLSAKLCIQLAPEFECIHVKDIGLGSGSDFEIWEYASSSGYSIVTKDEDFNSLSQVKGFPPHVVWIRLGNCSTGEVLHLLKRNASAIAEIIKNGDAGIIQLA